jgi:hypothetical protein
VSQLGLNSWHAITVVTESVYWDVLQYWYQWHAGSPGGFLFSELTVADGCLTSQAPPLIVPRVIFELTPQDLVRVLQQPTGVIDVVVSEMQKQGLDGLVSKPTEGQGWAGLGRAVLMGTRMPSRRYTRQGTL